MEDLMRCPICHAVPEVIIDGDLKAAIRCEQHGHMAMGDTLEKAVEHWNIYIRFIIREAA